jgi:hypothetical protein
MNDKKREAENMASLLDLEQTLYGKDVPVSSNAIFDDTCLEDCN